MIGINGEETEGNKNIVKIKGIVLSGVLIHTLNRKVITSPFRTI